jgi:hypothetical protein
MRGKTFGEDISKLIKGRDKLDREILAKHPFSNKMEVHFNVFGASMKHGIGSNGKSRNVITP